LDILVSLASGVLPAQSNSGPAPGAAPGAPVAMQAPVTVSVTPPTDISLSAAVEAINRALTDGGRELAFSIDEDSGRTIVRVLDSVSGELVRQFPSPEALILAERLRSGESLTSLGVDAWS
jgi:flagellar protein FlaG